MMIELGYGNRYERVEVPERNLAAVLVPNRIRHEHRGPDSVRHALAHPIGTPRLRDMVRAKLDTGASAQTGEGFSVVIITSDITRPMPSYDVLPSVLDELYDGGCRPEDITVVIARGSHRESTEAERKKLVGERCFNEVEVIDSSYEDCISYGRTKAGTPVNIDRRVALADMRILLGNIEFHYFAGYSGGCKALTPGVSTPEAIQANHSMMVSEKACAGNLINNPVRDDLEEACSMVGADFIVNCVLDEHKKIVHTVAGDVVKAHREGCRYLDRMYRVETDEPADIIIVSQGGAPKDVNLYQTQKALDNSKHIIKDGGTIILVGECREGMGNKTFESWLTEAGSPHELIDRIRTDFRLGGHKAAAIAMVLEHAEIYLVSGMDPEFVRSIFLKPAASAAEAFDEAMKKHGPDARVVIMPYGGSVLPSCAHRE